MNGSRKLSLVVAAVLTFAPFGFSSATDVYITPNGSPISGTPCTSNTQPPSWFNNSANWGAGTSKIGPGTTVHLCGTFTASAGASGYLTFQGGGSSGSPVSLRFESGAVLTAPYWGSKGAISAVGGLSYVVVDGGKNGTIQATLNGSPGATCLGGACQYQQNGFAVNMSPGSASCNNCEIKNLTISDMYMHTASSNDSGGNNGIGMNGNNISIDNNSIHDTCWAINTGYAPAGTSNVSVFNNTLYNIDHGVAVGDTGNAASLSGLYIYGNVIHDFSNWDTTGNYWHHDGIHVFANYTSSISPPVMIYNNYIYGNWGANDNAGIYLEVYANSSNMGTHYVFNNIFAPSGGMCANGAINDLVHGTGMNFYNNTMVGNGVGACGVLVGSQAATSSVIENSIYSGNGMSGQTAIIDTTGGSTMSTSDYNSWYKTYTGDAMRYNAWYTSVALWTSGTGFDRNSITSNPNLNSNYQPNSGSPVIGAGTNLYSTCNGQPVPGLGALCNDYAGNPRPSSGNWDIGAYAYATGDPPPAPPTGLAAVVR